MSTISTIYDTIQTTVATLFPLKLELSDPLNIENNDDKTLANGYGIQLGSAVNSNRQLCNTYSVQRDFIVTITMLNAATHKSITIFDASNKTLLEDLHLLIQTLAKENSAIRNVNGIVDWISDGGIEKYNGESREFLIIRATFRLEYFESLT
jgi:hypothetical protein